MWKQTLGVDATLKNEEWKVYLDTRDKKQFDITRAAWIGDYPDPSQLPRAAHSQIAGTQQRSGLQQPDFEAIW